MARLERAMREEGLAGLRLSPIYDRDVVWLSDEVSYPLWHRAEELGAVFNIFLAPHQVGQVAALGCFHGELPRSRWEIPDFFGI